MTRMISIVLPAVVLLTTANVNASESQRARLRTALSAFDDAIANTQDSQAAREHYATAAAGFESLIAEGVHNAAIYYDLANAYYRLGDVGRSVLNYRRAEQLDPGDPRIVSNLRLARQRVTPYIEPAEQTQIWRQLFFWHYSLSISNRLWIGASLSATGWALVLLAVWQRRRAWGIVGGLVILHGLGAATSVGWELSSQTQTPAAVIVQGHPILRLGRGEGQDAALSDPLGPGVELRILSERAGWLEVSLVDGQTGWIPAEGVERLTPALRPDAL
jgi:tetratricopeptide (TPR) repeat protein